MSATNEVKPPRPCTEYNIYFQLERAFILQVLLNVRPTSEEVPRVFYPSQPSYIGLPPLPQRYSSLVLPDDWHLPGKQARRNRKHRKSHGAISFQDLSTKVANGWKGVCNDSNSNEIKKYCNQVAQAGVRRYKAEMKEWKKRHAQGGDSVKKQPATSPKKMSPPRHKLVKLVSNDYDSPLPQEHVPQDVFSNIVPQVDVLMSAPVSEDEIDQALSMWAEEELFSDPVLDSNAPELFDIVLDDLEIKSDEDKVPSSEAEAFTSSISSVDVADNEILDMWKGENTSNHMHCYECTTSPSSNSATPTSSRPAITPSYPSNKVQVRRASMIGLQYQSMFGSKSYNDTLQEMQAMKAQLEQQVEQLVELEKHTVVARSA